MSNEQEITVKVRVPEGKECRRCKFYQFAMFGSLEEPDKYDCLLFGLAIKKGEKCQPCLDACEREKRGVANEPWKPKSMLLKAPRPECQPTEREE